MKKSLTRRGFLLLGGAACCYVVTSRKGLVYAQTEREVTIHPGVGIGMVKPELHGHFAEHLGACTYGGLWVGIGSKIENINGYRKQAVEYLRELGIPVLRWPGGCFADDYHWRDGIGPREKRPKRVNIHWGNSVEDNSFGTHEFIGLCRLIGAQPYFAGNLGSGTPQELRDWIEYCNYPSGSTLSDERVGNGSPDPFQIRYWGVGNENWGCGGNMTPDEYAGQYSRFATYIRSFGDTTPFLIACGPSSNDLNWTRRFFDAIQQNRRRSSVNGYTMQFYSSGRAIPTQFTVELMREQLSSFSRMEKAIQVQRSLIDSYDPDKKIGFMVDEWGTWDRGIPEEEKRLGRLWQMNTMRNAVAAAMGLNVFHRQADKLVMCNIAQIVNVLQAMLLTDGDKCIRTPSYYAFALCKPHRSKTSVAVENNETTAPGLSVSASRKDQELVLTYVNPLHDTAMKVSTRLSEGKAENATAQILHDDDYNACNTFDAPDRIVPKDYEVKVSGSQIQLDIPPLSVLTITVRLT